MKLITLIVSLLVASSTFANTYKCAETASTALKENRLQYSVILNELESIKDPEVVGENDAVGYVRVSILSRDPEAGGKFTLDRPSFKAVATYADVIFSIDAKAQYGFDLSMYMDEMDQTSMKIRGVSKRIRLNCTSDDHN